MCSVSGGQRSGGDGHCGITIIITVTSIWWAAVTSQATLSNRQNFLLRFSGVLSLIDWENMHCYQTILFLFFFFFSFFGGATCITEEEDD